MEALCAMLHQDVSFFDQEGQSSGSLAAFLSTEAVNLAGMSGATLGTIMNYPSYCRHMFWLETWSGLFFYYSRASDLRLLWCPSFR